MSGTLLAVAVVYRSVTIRPVHDDAYGDNMRHKRRKRREIGSRTSGEITDRVARGARYVGSAEHKAYPSTAGPPALRSDATPCDPNLSFDDIRAALVEGIRRGCVSTVMEQGFPKVCLGMAQGRSLRGAAHQRPGRNVQRLQAPAIRVSA